VNPEAIIAGIGAVVTAVIGLSLTMREFRSRERKAARAEMAQMVDDLYGVDEAYIAQRHYSYILRQMVADEGDLPPPPPVHRLTMTLGQQVKAKAKAKPPEPKAPS